MLKIYSDTQNIHQRNFSVIFPLLQPLTHPEWITEKSKKTNEIWRAQFHLTEKKEEADVFILALNLVDYKKTGGWINVLIMVEEAKIAQKPIWAFTAGDSGYTPNDPYITLIRMGGYRSRNSGNQWVIPPFIDDPLEKFNDIKPTFKPKEGEPRVGFCGQANASIKMRFKKIVGTGLRFSKKILGKYPLDLEKWQEAQVLRYRLLKKLTDSPGVNSNFIYRKAYRAGAKTEADLQKTTREYFENIIGSNYVLCLRGEGNYSVRLYETLACGRIPLYVETDSILPLEKQINWEKHLVKVSFENKWQLANQLVQFHNNLGDQDFLKLQEANRQLWLNQLSFMGFWNHFVRMQGLPIAKIPTNI